MRRLKAKLAYFTRVARFVEMIFLLGVIQDEVDFLKVVRLVFWSGVVGPGAFARLLARASRSLSRYALKSSTCEQVYYSSSHRVCIFPTYEKFAD